MKNIQSQAQYQEQDHYFQFEADFVGDLKCIPMVVRMHLDNCGVKLKLAQWNQFSQAERQTLVDLPCITPEQRQAYRQWLQDLVIEKTGQPAKEFDVDPHPPWIEDSQIPHSVQVKVKESNVALSVEQWSNLSPSQRFAIIKLSRPSHENRNFIPALKEFGILDQD